MTNTETDEREIQIFINKKEMPYSHQNMIRAINSFFPYLTNDDLDELMKACHTLKFLYTLFLLSVPVYILAKLETLKYSWPYPDTKQQPEND